MKIWKRNLVAIAVLLTVCAGIYANWLYTEDQSVANLTDSLDSEKIMDSDTLVMSDGKILPLEDQITNSTDYFAAVRLSRQQARDNAVGLLQEAMAYDKDTEASQAGAKLDTIVQSALNEAQIESLVIAKGYSDCVAYIADEGISVAVAAPDGGLKQEDVAVIADIVMSQSDYKIADIRVVEVP